LSSQDNQQHFRPINGLTLRKFPPFALWAAGATFRFIARPFYYTLIFYKLQVFFEIFLKFFNFFFAGEFYGKKAKDC